MRTCSLFLALSPLAIVAASCHAAPSGDNAANGGFSVTEIAHFDEPWAMAFIPGTPLALITERWPIVSNGDNYDGTPIPRHSTRPEFAAPAISWNPVIAPGDFIFYRGSQFPAWRGQAIIGGMNPNVLVRVAIDGEKAREVARTPMPHRIREIEEREDGSIWLLEDGKENGAGRLLKLSPVGQ